MRLGTKNYQISGGVRFRSRGGVAQKFFAILWRAIPTPKPPQTPPIRTSQGSKPCRGLIFYVTSVKSAKYPRRVAHTHKVYPPLMFDLIWSKVL